MSSEPLKWFVDSCCNEYLGYSSSVESELSFEWYSESTQFLIAINTDNGGFGKIDVIKNHFKTYLFTNNNQNLCIF